MIIRVCCVCHIILGYLAELRNDRRVTHTFCPKCFVAYEAKINALEASLKKEQRNAVSRLR